MFKLYNPYKPHVVKFNNGMFGVRKKLFMIGYEYYDQKGSGTWWYGTEYVPKYCLANSVDDLKLPIDKGAYIG
jgi:hypothetical protein